MHASIIKILYWSSDHAKILEWAKNQVFKDILLNIHPFMQAPNQSSRWMDSRSASIKKMRTSKHLWHIPDVWVTVPQLVKSNDIASSLPKSCMGIKESFSVSQSEYYTIQTAMKAKVLMLSIATWMNSTSAHPWSRFWKDSQTILQEFQAIKFMFETV